MPGCLLDGAEEAGVAERVPAPGHVRFLDQLETDRTQKVHVLLLLENRRSNHLKERSHDTAILITLKKCSQSVILRNVHY